MTHMNLRYVLNFVISKEEKIMLVNTISTTSFLSFSSSSC